MNDMEKWSAHLEYLKVAITLSTALLAVAAAFYSDPSKTPLDASKYMLLTSTVFVFLTLVFSIWSVIYLSNYLRRSNPNDQDAARVVKITRAAGASFASIIAAGLFILLFFWMRTFSSGSIIPALQATETVSSVLKGQINNQKESLIFNKLELKEKNYLLDYTVMPSTTKFQASVYATNGQIEWIKQQQ